MLKVHLEIQMLHVNHRVQQDGHGIPENDIEKRCEEKFVRLTLE